MPSSGRHILDIKKKPSSRTKARAQMGELFSAGRARPKPVRLRDQRRKKRLILTCLYLLAACGFVGVLGAVSHVEQLAIDSVSVTGAQALSAETLVAAASAPLESDSFELFSRENIFLYPRSAMRQALQSQFPRIKNVSVARPSLLAQAVVVTVEERAPYAKWCPSHGAGAETCYLLDSAGYIFAEATNETPELSYTFHGGLAPGFSPVGQWFLRGRIGGIVAFVDKLKQAGFETTDLSVDSEKDFSVRLAQGPVLLIPFDLDADAALRNLQITLAADGLDQRLGELEYIDLRFGNRVYYK